jgi:hypothetical protein
VISYRDEIKRSWVRDETSARSLAELLGESAPVSLSRLVQRLREVETITLDKDITTDDGSAINGHVQFELHSNGDYVFSGNMRATGLTSYHFGVQAWVRAGDDALVAAQRMGSVHGSDSVGDRQDNWKETGTNPGIQLSWRSLRSDPHLGFAMNAGLSGLLGAAVDVLTFALEGIAANLVVGPTGWIVLIGTELAPKELQPGTPDVLAGVLVAGGALFVLGPFGVIPAAVAGLTTAALVDVKHRDIHQDERDFANRVFNGQIDFDKVVLTNMSHSGGTKYTVPSVGDRILVNLDDAYDAPMSYANKPDPKTVPEYVEPGSVFIHELTHAWQITHKNLIQQICGLSHSYGYTSDPHWPNGPWSEFDNEQQAHIVDDWYGANVVKQGPDFLLDAQGVPVTDLDGTKAVQDKAFRFITENIRTGRI